MKLLKLLVIINLGISTYSFGQDAGINFQEINNLEAVKKVAANTGKNIFVTLHYVGCPHCTRMEKNTFPTREVSDFYNQNFICLSLDINNDSLGVFFKKQFNPGAYPAYIFLDKNAKLLHMDIGYKTVDEFINIGKKSTDSTKNFAYYKNKVEKGDISAETLNKYFSLSQTHQRDSLINEYLSNCSENQKYSIETWTLLSQNTPNYRSPFFWYVVENENQFRQTAGNKAVDDFLILHWSFMINQWSEWWVNNFQRNKMKKELRATNHPLCERIIRRVDFMVWIDRAAWRKNSKYKWGKMIEASEKYLNFDYDDWYNYYRASQLIYSNYKNIGKPEDIQLGLLLAEKSISCHKEFMNLFVYALILNETGAKEKAITTLKEAFNYQTDHVEKRYIKMANDKLSNWTSKTTTNTDDYKD